MPGIQLTQAGGAGVLNDAGVQNPAQFTTVITGAPCLFSIVGVTIANPLWTSGGGANAPLSSTTAQSVQLTPDLPGNYSVTLSDQLGTVYTLQFFAQKVAATSFVGPVAPPALPPSNLGTPAAGSAWIFCDATNSGKLSAKTPTATYELTPTISVQKFGAKGDGTTDDTAALQAWLAAIPDGAEGYIPPGTYRFTTGLSFGLNGSGKPKRINLRGEGIASILLADVGTSADGLTIGILAPAPTTGPFAYVEGIHLSNFVIMGKLVLGQGNVRHALRLNNLARCTSRNVHVLGGTRTGGIDLYVYGCLVNDFQFILSTNQQYPGFTNPGVSNTHIVYLQDAGPTNPGVLSQCNANKFHLFAEGGTGVAIYQDDQAGYGDNWFDGTIESASSSAAFYFKNSADWVVHNCHIEGFAGGIVIDGGHAGTIGPGVPVVTIAGASTATGAGARIDPRIGGVASVSGEVGLPAAINGAAYYSGPSGSASGRIGVGDGSGLYFALAKRTGSAWTDFFKFYDNGLAYAPIWIGDSFQVNSGTTCSSTGLYNAPKLASMLKMRNAANSGDLPVLTGDTGDQIRYGDISLINGHIFAVNPTGAWGVNDGATNWISSSSTFLRTQTSDIGFFEALTGAQFRLAPRTSNAACSDVTIAGQTPFVSATGTNRNSGGVAVAIPNPVAGGAAGTYSVTVAGTLRFRADGTGIGFYTTAPVAKPSVTGSKGANAALTSLLTALANLGLITDSSS